MGGNRMYLKIYNQQDRLDVATILLKNGYTVSQTKRKNNPNGKTVDYYLAVEEDTENANTAK